MTIQLATSNGVQDTATSLLSLLDYWECMVNLRNKSAGAGCFTIEAAIGELQLGDVFIVAGQVSTHFDAVARALAIQSHNENKQTLFMGDRTRVRHFMCEVVGRELELPVSKVLKARFTDAQWWAVNECLEKIRKLNALYTAVAAESAFEYYIKTLEETLSYNPKIQVVIIEGVTDKSWLSETNTKSIAQRLKELALRHKVSLIVSVGISIGTSELAVRNCLPESWALPAFVDGILLCEHSVSSARQVACQPAIDLRYDSRTGLGHLSVALYHDGIGRIDVCPLPANESQKECEL